MTFERTSFLRINLLVSSRFGEDIILIDKPFQRREGEKKKRRW